MRDGKYTTVVPMGAVGVCHDCGAEVWGGGDAWRWARSHAKKTGHCPTVNVTYDIHAKSDENSHNVMERSHG